MPPSDIPTILPWNKRIDNHVFLAKTSFLSDNFTAFETLLAESIESGIDYRATLDKYVTGNNANIGDAIQDINTECVQKGQVTYDNFSNRISALKDTTPDEATWRDKIDQAAVEAKNAANNAIDSAAQLAKDTIGKLPEPAQNAAADLFIAGTKAVMNFFSNVWDGIKTVVNAIREFLVGVWDKITSAWSAIKSAAQLAITFITGRGGYERVTPIIVPNHNSGLQLTAR